MKQPIRKLNGRRTQHPARPVRQVVAALILRGEKNGAATANGNGAGQALGEAAGQAGGREIFICQRRPDQPMGLKWEFPGGKVEPGETSEQALARELREELGIAATIGPHVTTIHHTYRNGGAIEIEFFSVTHFENELINHIFHQMLWSPISRLPDYDFLAADLTLIRDLADGKLL